MEKNVKQEKGGSYNGISYSIKYTMDETVFRINPDRSIFYKTHIAVVKGDQEIEIPNDIYVESKEDEGIWHSLCMAVNTSEDIIYLFAFEKDDNSSRYGMTGYVYEITDGTIQRYKVFDRANWGWMPYFDYSSGDLALHAFSFAGYYALEGTEENGWDMQMTENIMPDEFKALQEEHDKILFFSPDDMDDEEPEEDEEDDDIEFDDDFLDFLKNAESEESFTPCHKISEKIGEDRFYQLNQAAMWGAMNNYIQYRQSLLQCNIDVIADSQQYTFAIDSLNHLEGEMAEYESLDDYAARIEDEYLRGNFQAYIEFVLEMQFMSWAVYKICGDDLREIGIKYGEIYDRYLSEKRTELLNEREARLALKILYG